MGVLQQAMDGTPTTKVHLLLNKLRNRELAVQMPKGPVNAEGYGDDARPVNRSVIKELLLQVDGLLPNSWLEPQAVRNDLQWHGEAFEVAHYGVDPSLFLDPDPNPFRKATGIETPFVLQAGRIEPAKKSGDALLGPTRDKFTDCADWRIEALARICRSLQKHRR